MTKGVIGGLLLCGLLLLIQVNNPVFAEDKMSDTFASLQFYTEDYEPFNFIKNDTLTGVSVDVLKEIYIKAGTNLSPGQISLGTWEEGYQKAMHQRGTIIFSTARSPEREDLFLWVGPIMSDSHVIFGIVPGSGEISSFEKLAGLRIGGITDDIAATDLMGMGYQDLYLASDVLTLVEALENGTIDGWAYAEKPGRSFINRYAENGSAIQPVYTIHKHDYYYAFNNKTPESVIDTFQTALDEIKKQTDENGDTRYDTIMQQYAQPGV